VTSARDPPAPVRGLWCATLTPIDRAARFDAPRLVDHLHFLFEQGVQGVALFGTTGEGPSFSTTERMAGLDATLARGIATDRLVAATGCSAWSDTIELTRHAANSGVRRCLVLPPYFFKDLHDDWVYACYAELLDAVAHLNVQVYLYHIPQFTGVPIAVDVVARLAQAYPRNIAGIKDSGGDWSYTEALLARLPALAILVGHEPHLPRLVQAGGAGTICGVANVAPQLVAPLLAEAPTADDQARIERFLAALFRFPFLAAFKAMKAAQVRDAAWCSVRRPLGTLSREEQKTLVNTMAEAGFGALVHALR
jgi:4-hydroxy-tetrahydrodipicolinate synthase